MYPNNNELDQTAKASIGIMFFKVAISIILLLLGIHVTLWSMEMIQVILSNPESLSFVNKFMSFQGEKQTIEILFNNDPIIVKTENIFKWGVLIVIFLVLFNVIGKALSGIFSSLATIVISLDFSNKLNNQDYKEE